MWCDLVGPTCHVFGHSKGKGSSAAAAAAARRQWKVGDLVLAKVKGFPAWPATVSEPEKWGYSADWKKVLVYFFGTNQIAFCNPADVEAFTEEKKESLLVKRQGKGADFVRAVQEIIDSYEKSKKEDRVDSNSGDEVIVTNAGNSVDSFTSSGLKDQTEASSGTLLSRLNNSNSTGDRDEPSLLAEDAAAETQLDASHDRETFSEEPTVNVVITETPFTTTYSSRKRSGGTQPQSRVTQRRAPSVRRSRSSSRSDSCRFQNFIVPSNDGGKSAGDVASNVMRYRSLRRNKRIRKSPDASEWHDAGSPAFISNGSIEDDGSEIVTVDSDTLSLNEGSTLESGCNLEHTETVECLEGEAELSKRLDLQIKAVVIKKKRKPNRKRVINDASGRTDGLEKAACLEVGINKTRQNSPNDCEKSNEGYSKEDGDEHLPLVKRARVRMGKQSAAGEELDSVIKMEEKSSKEVSINLLGQVCTSLNCDNDSPADRNSFVVKGTVENSSSLNNYIQIPENGQQLLKVKEKQPFGSVDGEAALPPSKRLHRALEAMSANAAEDGQACTEAPSTRKSLTDRHCAASIRGSPHMSVEGKAGNGLGVQNVDSLGNNASEDCMCGFSASSNPLISEEIEMSSVDVDICNEPDGSSKSKKDEVEPAESVVQTQSPEPLSPNLDTRQGSPRANQGSLHQLSSKDECKSENFELSHSRAESPDREVDASKHTGTSIDTVSRADKSTKVSPRNSTNVVLYSAEDSFCENTEFLKPPRDHKSQVNGMCELEIEVKHKSFQSSKEVMKDAVRGTQHLSHSGSISNDPLGEKDVSCIRSSPSPLDGVDFPARASPPNSLLCSMNTTDNNLFLQNNGCCSPDVHLHHEKSVCALDVEEGKFDSVVTCVGKWSNHAEASAALTSFEAMLGTLTRTKESIGRATRIAIDCAKFGIAAKVMEILARRLESESSLHRRVDLFFLVDSIAQCSRGLKGDVGGIYPSAIQAVLPRLLSAAAPPGNTAQENRRQCLKASELFNFLLFLGLLLYFTLHFFLFPLLLSRF
ncbi:hypothetical protein L1049_004537 [Liquidambar formosana]|uniref:PWWP domain-containing protein n=1 Tax=Liquidambar formosana TaxID=63359 RepID=A0AAP0WVS7_LIQFO